MKSEIPTNRTQLAERDEDNLAGVRCCCRCFFCLFFNFIFVILPSMDSLDGLCAMGACDSNGNNFNTMHTQKKIGNHKLVYDGIECEALYYRT